MNGEFCSVNYFQNEVLNPGYRTMQRILYLIQKEFRQVFRDRAMVLIMFLAPVIQTIVLGFAMNTDVKNVKLLIYDADNSAASRELCRRFVHNPYFNFVGYAQGSADIHHALQNWRTQIGIFIPIDFDERLVRG